MPDREPDYASYSLSDLLDVEGRIDQRAYPERWSRLQEELARRRATSNEAGEFRRSARDPVMGLPAYVILHLILCPALGIAISYFLEDGGEGAGWLPLVAGPLGAAFSLGSLGTYAVYRDARNPQRFFLFSIALWTSAPFLLGASVALFVRALEFLG